MVNLVMAALILIIIVMLFLYVVTGPLRLLWKLIINSLFGVLLLLITNFVGAYVAFALPVNIVTILVSGFMGVPGIILLIGVKLLLK
jgi:inhibitor of the pro-sigma K processing machinery